MTETYSSCMQEILADPEDDRPRHALATLLRNSDPLYASVIEHQLAVANEYRTTGRVRTTDTWSDARVREHGHEWAPNLYMFLGEFPDVTFRRGLPWSCTMNPYLFLEQGEYVMNRIAPLRSIEFWDDSEGAPFPMKELVESPLLERLDHISFASCTLSVDDIERFARCTRLTRLVTVDLHIKFGAFAPYSAEALLPILCSNPSLRRCLVISNEFRNAEGRPSLEFFSHTQETYGPFIVALDSLAAELEAKHGYIPWFHIHNLVERSNARWYVEHDAYPRYLPGSPADNPTPHGHGFHERFIEVVSRDVWLDRIESP